MLEFQVRRQTPRPAPGSQRTGLTVRTDALQSAENMHQTGEFSRCVRFPSFQRLEEGQEPLTTAKGCIFHLLALYALDRLCVCLSCEMVC